MVYIPDPEMELYFAKEEALPIVRSLSCPLHHRKARVIFDYDNRGTNAHITKYCCQAFADVVAKKLEELQRFYDIEIKNTEQEM